MELAYTFRELASSPTLARSSSYGRVSAACTHALIAFGYYQGAVDIYTYIYIYRLWQEERHRRKATNKITGPRDPFRRKWHYGADFPPSNYIADRIIGVPGTEVDRD